ncbi:MAG TPA: zf-HC2 domain-containing protein, partial [Bryobacteraceae bacterium]|nr:zf-HC2 domain-containing protein [Bryobacteraceae bacterium]
MTRCWSEGELRAHLDGELPAGDMRRVEEHLRGCAACADLHAAMAARAARITALLEALPFEPAEVRRARPRYAKKTAGAVLGLAASLALAFVTLPRRAQ